MKKKITSFFTGFLLVILLLLASIAPAFAEPPTRLAWDESPEADVQGYYIYYGPLSSGYTDVIQVLGKATTSYLLADVPVNYDVNKCYFVITAYNAENESPYSNEVDWPNPSKVKNLRREK